MNWSKQKIADTSLHPDLGPRPHYETHGSGGKHILFIHGFGLNRKTWYDILPIVQSRHTMIMVDLIGFGDSPAPEIWPYTIEAQADTIIQFIIEKKFKNLVLTGHSYGGGVTLMVLHKLREMGKKDLIKDVILIAPAAFPQTLPFFVFLPKLSVIGPLILKIVHAEFQIHTVLKKIFNNKKAVTRERVKRYAYCLSNPGGRNALIRTADHIIPANANNLLNKIKAIHHSTLLIYGEKDNVIKMQNLERLSATLPNVATEIIPGCGHVPQEEFPEATAALILNFL